MAATNWTAYTQGLLSTMGGSVNWSATTLKVGLLTTAYTPAVNTDTVWSAISSSETSGTGYTAGGVAVTSPTVTASGATVTAAGTIASWTSSTFNARYGVLYDSASGKLLAYTDLTGSGNATVINGSLALTGYSATLTHTP